MESCPEASSVLACYLRPGNQLAWQFASITPQLLFLKDSFIVCGGELETNWSTEFCSWVDREEVTCENLRKAGPPANPLYLKPDNNVGLFPPLFPSWVDPLFWTGCHRTLEHSDLYEQPSGVDSGKLLERFNK